MSKSFFKRVFQDNRRKESEFSKRGDLNRKGSLTDRRKKGQEVEKVGLGVPNSGPRTGFESLRIFASPAEDLPIRWAVPGSGFAPPATTQLQPRFRRRAVPSPRPARLLLPLFFFRLAAGRARLLLPVAVNRQVPRWAASFSSPSWLWAG